MQRLRAEGHAVRALTRDPHSERARHLYGEGVKVVRGDLLDRASLDRALVGVTRVFTMATLYNGATAASTPPADLGRGAARCPHPAQSGACSWPAPEAPVSGSRT